MTQHHGSSSMQQDGASPDLEDPDHPLYGVDNYLTLPNPEPLSVNYQKEAEPLLRIYGDHVVCCLYSRQRTLREAGLAKVNQLLTNHVTNAQQARELLVGLVALLKRTCADKIALRRGLTAYET